MAAASGRELLDQLARRFAPRRSGKLGDGVTGLLLLDQELSARVLAQLAELALRSGLLRQSLMNVPREARVGQLVGRDAAVHVRELRVLRSASLKLRPAEPIR